MTTLTTFRILIKGDGGEFVLGSVSEPAASYWVTQDSAALCSYVANPDGSEFEPVDEGFRLPSWRDLDHFAHEYGVEGLERLIVEDGERNELHSLSRAELDERGLFENGEVKERQSIGDHKGHLIFARSHEKGYCIFPLTTSGKFDINKLRLQIVDLWDNEIVNQLSYAGNPLTMEESFSRDYADVEAEITAPF